jgi:hypothetical protein
MTRELGKTQKNYRFTLCCFQSDEELQFVDIFSATKFVMLCSVELLYYIVFVQLY